MYERRGYDGERTENAGWRNKKKHNLRIIYSETRRKIFTQKKVWYRVVYVIELGEDEEPF